MLPSYIIFDIKDSDRPARWRHDRSWTWQAFANHPTSLGISFLGMRGFWAGGKHDRLRLDDGWLNGGFQGINAKSNFVRVFCCMTDD